jgi:apoptosis-inducing factor 3
MPLASKPPAADTATRIVIVGGGAVGFAAAEMLRRRGFDGDLSVLTADDAAPYDRPNLSKDYLAGEAPEDWIPLRDLHLGVRADRIDAAAQVVACADGRTFP